ncbi:MAG: hypothetical protein ABR976_19605 [Terracidiphilus sp.]
MKCMERRLFSVLTSAMLIAAYGALVAAQTVREVTPSEPSVKEVTPVERPIPFSTGTRDSVELIKFRSVDQMTEKDRDLVADAESSISERSGFLGMDFNGGKWSYEQVVCSAIPNHILLRFTRNNGTGDVSIFSASIPRNGDGRVRIIPIQMRGYSLFSPAPINALTISAFNHIRAEEHFDSPPDWLGTGLCYAALAGGRPLAALPAEQPESWRSAMVGPPRLQIQNGHNVVLTFVDVSATPRPMEWTMNFDIKGNLLKAMHRPAELVQTKVVVPAPISAATTETKVPQ